MRAQILRRLNVWWHEAWLPVWITIGLAMAIAGFADTLAARLGVSEQYRLLTFFSGIETSTWWILWLAITAAILLERIFHLAQSRDGYKQQLDVNRTNQALSDLLSDRHEYGVHELLNKPPTTDSASIQSWLHKEDQWLKAVLAIMDQHGCTKQERRHVNTIGLFSMIPLHDHPVVSHRLSMLVTRLSRIADVARKYGE